MSHAHGVSRGISLVQELGRRMTAVTEDTREATYLFQRMSVALQRGNAVSFHRRSQEFVLGAVLLSLSLSLRSP